MDLPGIRIGGSNQAPHRAGGLRAAIAIAIAVAASGCTQASTALSPAPAKCQVSLATTSSAVDASGGSVSVAVTTQSECAWTATSDVSWMTLPSSASGQGTGSVDVRISANPNGTTRSGDITVNGQSVQIGQGAAKCQFSIAPASQTLAAAGGPGTVAVTAPSGCTWTVTDVPGWITVTSGASGNGNGTVTFTVGVNPTGSPRTATLTIAGQPFPVIQQPAGCSYTIDRNTETLPAGGGAGTPIALTATPGCTWTATSSAPWITGVSPSSGTGNGTVSFSVAANPTGSPRTGTLTVAGQIITVTQDAAGCSYSLDRTSQSFPAGGGAGTPIVITATPGCTWTATSNTSWITGVTPGSGTGNGTVNFSVAANPNGVPRTGTLTVASQTFTVTQDAAGCSYSLDHTFQFFSAAGGNPAPIVITATPGCTWTATSNDPWLINVTPGGGTGNGTVNYFIAANPNGTLRTGTLTVAGQIFTVNQQAAPCSYSLDHASQSFSAGGGAGTPIVITATPGCGWTAASNAPWITGVTPAGGTGNGAVTFSVSVNPNGTPRTGTLTVAGHTFTVTQDAAPCSYSLDHTSQSFTSAGGAGTPIVITATPGCTWTATNTNNVPWITGVLPSSGTGNGIVNFVVAPNVGAARMSTLTIAGKTFTVTQAKP
jgi:Putative binding domain, N-terminal/Viral BACON domain